jgi:hypothetical protein
LTEDRLSFVSVVTQYGGVPNDPALSVLNFDCSGISGRQRRDVSDEFCFVENAAFFVSENAVLGEIFFPRRLISGHNRVVKLLSATDQLFLRNRNVRGADDGCGRKECDECEFHEKG